LLGLKGRRNKIDLLGLKGRVKKVVDSTTIDLADKF